MSALCQIFYSQSGRYTKLYLYRLKLIDCSLQCVKSVYHMTSKYSDNKLILEPYSVARKYPILDPKAKGGTSAWLLCTQGDSCFAHSHSASCLKATKKTYLFQYLTVTQWYIPLRANWPSTQLFGPFKYSSVFELKHPLGDDGIWVSSNVSSASFFKIK